MKSGESLAKRDSDDHDLSQAKYYAARASSSAGLVEILDELLKEAGEETTISLSLATLTV